MAMRTPDQIKKIYIDKAVGQSELAHSIRSKLADSQVLIEEIDDPKAVLDHYQKNGALFEKDTLMVFRFPGRFLSSCPGSDGMICCQYFVINFGVGCLYDCHYCYLQNFLNHPLMTLFGNLEDMFTEIDKKISGRNFHFRVGTGEYTDSLALEPITGISSILVNHFANIPNATLELKTKSTNVDDLIGLDHKEHTVVSWSLNPQNIIDDVEPGTASLEERLQAAEKAMNAGYRLAFHFDPVIYHEGWESNYHRLLEEVFDRINTNRISWISLGSFRHSPGQKEIMQSRFASDSLTKQEMVQGSDGKYRYFKTIREPMYASIRKKIKQIDPKLFLYLCMETQRMWEGVFGFVPSSSKNLDSLFDQRRRYIDSLTSTAE
ncbi:MAG: radical SAM protein [Leptonema sp. (in: Bacteria)]|nr:radical SAM protein [Leptonema sp. (in: bacteria)]